MKWSKTTGLWCQSRRSTNKCTSTRWRDGRVHDRREECKACADVRIRLVGRIAISRSLADEVGGASIRVLFGWVRE